jgi:hypothetical protein
MVRPGLPGAPVVWTGGGVRMRRLDVIPACGCADST